jgi:2-polyprenyl-3-methyl-5-hydroxy-6-metoxy-1,4-benzoquinol methylase
MKDFWNERYAQEDYAYGTAPNAFFKEILDSLPKGSVLLPADGEGRNAVYAAKCGHEVLAVDMSESGREKALSLAQEEEVNIDYIVSDLLSFTTEKKFDVIALIYAHFPKALRKEIHQKLIQLLKPKGVLIVEAFHPKQLNFSSGGPKNEEMLYSLDVLRSDFDEPEEIYAKELTVLLDEGEHHQGEAAVTRFVAVKA